MPATPPSNGERLLRVVPEHWIQFVIPSIAYTLLLGISVLLFLLASISAHHDMWLSHVAFFSALVLFLADHHWFFFFLLGQGNSTILVTNRRVIHLREQLFVTDSMREVSFDKMKSVEAMKRGLLQNILRYGSIRFEGTNFVISHVPHPNSVARDIEQAMGLR